MTKHCTMKAYSEWW